MNNRETYQIVKENFKYLDLESNYKSGSDFPYITDNLNRLRDSIIKLEIIPFLQEIIANIKSTALFTNSGNTISFDISDYNQINKKIDELRIGLFYIIQQFESVNELENESTLAIKLPEIKTFSELVKIANDFKKAIEIPLLDSKIESELDIKSAEPGSIWLMVGVGATVAINLIGGIVWSAAVIKKKKAEANIFEAHAKTLDLKNEQIELYVKAQKTQLENLLNAEAEAIATEHYSHQDPETIERLKLSITTVSELIEKGARILPTSNSDNIKELFPNYNNLSMIQSAIKKISEN